MKVVIGDEREEGSLGKDSVRVGPFRRDRGEGIWGSKINLMCGMGGSDNNLKGEWKNIFGYQGKRFVVPSWTGALQNTTEKEKHFA